MRILLYLVIVLVAAACQAPKEPARNTTLVLKDNRGIIKMNLPSTWDTALQWKQNSDCSSCDELKYRFQPKKFPIALERGSFYTRFPKDSIEQLTIIQSVEKRKIRYTLEDFKQDRSAMREYFLKENYHAKFVMDTICQVGTHFIAAVGVTNKSVDEGMLSYDINAITIVKGDRATLEFKFLSKEGGEDGKLFVGKVMDIINSLQLEDE